MRLIDADALDEKLSALIEKYASMGRVEVANDYSFVSTVLMTAPTIDAVPVVRCGECERRKRAQTQLPLCGVSGMFARCRKMVSAPTENGRRVTADVE